MTIRTHLADLKEQRETYTRMLAALMSGKLASGDAAGDRARIQDVRRKIAALNLMIKTEETRGARGA